MYRYVLRLGFLDGKEGLVFHFLQGCWYRFQVDSYILEMRTRDKARFAGDEAGESAPDDSRLGRADD